MRKNRQSPSLSTTTTTARKAAAADVPPPDGLTPEAVTQILGLIDQIKVLIPGFQPHNSTDAKRVAAVARFAPDLIPQMINTVTALPSVGGVNTFDAVEGKASLEFDAAVQPLVQSLSSLLGGVQYTSNSRLAKSARQALSTYAWAKKHVKGPEGVELRPYLDQMAATMKKVLNRRKKPATPSTPPPAPAPKGAQGFLSPNLDAAKPVVDDDDDLPEDFRKQLEEALKD